MYAGASARPEGVNRPELLPKGEVTPVIDVAGFLAPSEEKKLRAEVEALERDTGFRLRVLAQNYPETPGEWGGLRQMSQNLIEDQIGIGTAGGGKM